MRILLGIDDTDNKDSRGTGYNSRQLAASIEAEGLGTVTGITRHQLFVHPLIPYTSQNSSACLDIITDDLYFLQAFSRNFMINAGAIGSDVGLCIARWDSLDPDVILWGNNAKSIVLKLVDAVKLARSKHIYLEGLTGTHDGMIGALAAIGLRRGGNDGRFIWINSKSNLRDIENDIHSVKMLTSEAGIDIIQCDEEIVDNPSDRVFLNAWARPVLRNNRSVLLVDNEVNNNDYEWKCSAREFVKRISN